MNKQIIQARAQLYANIRNYFAQRGYLEVETPLLSPELIPEPTIDCFESTFINEFEGSRQLYLIPSPEIFIKKLIAEGCGNVFEISKCFRNCEQVGNIHNPEFSMLEFYTMNADEHDSVKITEDFLQKTAIPSCNADVLKPWIKMSVRDAMIKYANIDIDELQNPAELRATAKKLNLHIPTPEPWDDTFNRIFCTFVETQIPKDCPVLFTDYPKQINCLAKQNGNYRRRWELYISGVEVANCYFEEDNAQKVREYYQNEYQKLIQIRSENGRPIPECNPNYADIFTDFPKCSGVAIGLDRLLMTELGKSQTDDVILFPFSNF